MEDFTFSSGLDSAFATVGSDGAVKYAEMNKGITPIFFIESIPDDGATERAGTLRMRDEERVRLFTSGDPNSSPVHPVTDEIRKRFGAAYKEWQATKRNDYIEGMPLKAWPLASKSFSMELEALHIRSVEDLSIASDAMVARIVDGRIWRDKALAWLATNKDASKAAEYAAQASRLSADNAELRAQLSELADRVRSLEGSKDDAPHRGRRAA